MAGGITPAQSSQRCITLINIAVGHSNGIKY